MVIKRITVNIDDEMLHKLRVVAEYERRSVSSEIRILIRDCIQAYEEYYGEIT